MDHDKYISGMQQRLLSVIRTLGGHEVDGLLPSQIASRAACSASQVTRDLANLRKAGWAEELPGAPGRWRLGPSAVALAMRHMTGMDRARQRLDETARRFGRSDD